MYNMRFVSAIVVLMALGNECTATCPSPCYCIEDTVYCNGTGITRIPSNFPPITRTLNLADNHIRTISNGSLTGLNTLMFLDISNNDMTDGGVEKGALLLPNLAHITSNYNQLTDIPETFPEKLVTLSVSNNAITTLKSGCLTNYHHLAYLDLSGNSLTRIEEGVFEQTPNLITLYMESTPITNGGIPNNFLSNNTKLQILRIQFGKLQRVPVRLPPSLTGLGLGGNVIDIISRDAFQGLTLLIELTLPQSNVKDIEDGAFADQHNVVLLILSKNELSSLTKQTFVGLTNLQSLYFDNNNISSIDPDTFASLANMTTLDLSGNRMTSLQPEVLDTTRMRSLKLVYLSSNYWYCDCHLRWLRDKMDAAQYVIADASHMKCSGPKAIEGNTWRSLKPTQFVC